MPQAATGVALEFRLIPDFIEIAKLLSTSIGFLPVPALRFVQKTGSRFACKWYGRS